MKNLALAAILATCLLIGAPVIAAETAVELQPGPGQELTSNTCNGCHSLDYIKMNSPFLTAVQWQAEVTKMRKAYGAPIDDADADNIIHYLSATYAVPAKP